MLASSLACASLSRWSIIARVSPYSSASLTCVVAWGGAPRVVGGVGWRRLEDKTLGIQAEGKEEEKRPWWKGKKPREAPEIDAVWAANSKTQGEQVNTVAWGLLLGAGQVTRGVREI